MGNRSRTGPPRSPHDNQGGIRLILPFNA